MDEERGCTGSCLPPQQEAHCTQPNQEMAVFPRSTATSLPVKVSSGSSHFSSFLGNMALRASLWGIQPVLGQCPKQVTGIYLEEMAS